MSRALILGGGGVTGIAWEIGVLIGLRDEGVDISMWDLVVGTSAGAVVGSKLLGAPDLDAVFAAQTLAATPADDLPVRTMAGRLGVLAFRLGRRRRLGWLPRVWLTAFAAETFVRQRAGRGARRIVVDVAPHPGLRAVAPADPVLARLGMLGIAARTAPESTFLRVVAETLDPVTDWPPALAVTAIDALDGTTVTITEASGVPFLRAVAASCAVPTLMPPITIGRRPYMDGGMASQTHAEVARGHDEVLVIAPIDIGRMAGEVAALRAAGARVTVITPGDEAQPILGRDIALLDPVRRAASAHAGVVDGRRAAAAGLATAA